MLQKLAVSFLLNDFCFGLLACKIKGENLAFPQTPNFKTFTSSDPLLFIEFQLQFDIVSAKS